jgi:hypothetical protein
LNHIWYWVFCDLILLKGLLGWQEMTDRRSLRDWDTMGLLLFTGWLILLAEWFFERNVRLFAFLYHILPSLIAHNWNIIFRRVLWNHIDLHLFSIRHYRRMVWRKAGSIICFILMMTACR